jgi:membrane protein YdbS with pleckstrin-like domain
MEENAFPKKIQMGISALLLISGIALYIVWGIGFNGWNFFEQKFIGLYALVIVMVLFGIFGILLTKLRKD